MRETILYIAAALALTACAAGDSMDMDGPGTFGEVLPTCADVEDEPECAAECRAEACGETASCRADCDEDYRSCTGSIPGGSHDSHVACSEARSACVNWCECSELLCQRNCERGCAAESCTPSVEAC